MSKESEKAVERSRQKEIVQKNNPGKYSTSKKRTRKHSGKAGHTSMSYKDCALHDKYKKQSKKERFIIKTSLKNMISLINDDMNATFYNFIQDLVHYSRNITYAISLFVNFLILKLLNIRQPIPVLNHIFLYYFSCLIIILGSKTLPNVVQSYNRSKEVLGD